MVLLCVSLLYSHVYPVGKRAHEASTLAFRPVDGSEPAGTSMLLARQGCGLPHPSTLEDVPPVLQDTPVTSVCANRIPTSCASNSSFGEHVKALRREARVAIVAVMHNSLPALPLWTDQVTRLLLTLSAPPYRNVFVSIVGVNSRDGTRAALESFAAHLRWMGVPHAITVNYLERWNQSEEEYRAAAWDAAVSGFTAWAPAQQFTHVLMLDAGWFCARDALQLLTAVGGAGAGRVVAGSGAPHSAGVEATSQHEHGRGLADMACAVDVDVGVVDGRRGAPMPVSLASVRTAQGRLIPRLSSDNVTQVRHALHVV